MIWGPLSHIWKYSNKLVFKCQKICIHFSSWSHIFLTSPMDYILWCLYVKLFSWSFHHFWVTVCSYIYPWVPHLCFCPCVHLIIKYMFINTYINTYTSTHINKNCICTKHKQTFFPIPTHYNDNLFSIYILLGAVPKGDLKFMRWCV